MEATRWQAAHHVYSPCTHPWAGFLYLLTRTAPPPHLGILMVLPTRPTCRYALLVDDSSPCSPNASARDERVWRGLGDGCRMARHTLWGVVRGSWKHRSRASHFRSYSLGSVTSWKRRGTDCTLPYCCWTRTTVTCGTVLASASVRRIIGRLTASPYEALGDYCFRSRVSRARALGYGAPSPLSPRRRT